MYNVQKSSEVLRSIGRYTVGVQLDSFRGQNGGRNFSGTNMITKATIELYEI